MKRQRAEREAGISNLPAPILHHILSFLDKKEALKTCLLSKSWRHLVSTRPKFSLDEGNFKRDKEKFRNVLDKSLQVYCDQKLCIDDFSVSCVSTDVPLLKKWIPIVTQDLGVKKFCLCFWPKEPTYFDVPAVVFESESLQEINLQRCKLSQIKCIGKNNHLKTLGLYDVYIEEESFAKLMSSCPLIERFTLGDCQGLRTINVQNHHNLQSIEIFSNKDYGRSIEIYLPSTIGDISIKHCPNWFHHRNYFPGLTFLCLQEVPVSNQWFNSLSRNFPCLKDLKLWNCKGFNVFQLSSRSIEYLHITGAATKSTTKATFDTPSIKKFHYESKYSQSAISFTTTSGEWISQSRLLLNKKVSLCFLKLKSLTCLKLTNVPLSNEWFSCFSFNFPCLEELKLVKCLGFDEMQLSSRSINNLDITMHKSTTKATIDAPSIKKFRYDAKISQSISFAATNSSGDWNSEIHLFLDQLGASQWFLKLSELVAEISQSQINSLVLYHDCGRVNNLHNIEHLSDISVCCSGSYKMPVAMKSLDLKLDGIYYDSFFSDLMNGLFRIIRPREISQIWFVDAQKDCQRKRNEAVEFLCRTLQMGRWEEEDEGMRSFFWQQDLEQVSLLVKTDYNGEWHPVEGITTSWSEYVAALCRPSHNFYQLRFLLKWRE